MTEIDTFGKYGKSFQEKIMQALLTDKKWAEQMVEVFDTRYFELKYLQYLSDAYFKYARKYKDYPSLQLLVTIIRDDLKSGQDVQLRDQIIDYLQRTKTNPDPGDLLMVKDKSLDFCRKQALKGAMDKAVDLIETEKYESIVDIIKTAVSVGTMPSLGHDFFDELESRFTLINRNVVPTGIPELDAKDVLQGGMGKGELLCCIGATGAGKSHFLTTIGANAIRNKFNVLHYTFELSEEKVGIRYDSNFCDIDSNEIIANKEKVIEYYSKEQAKLGRLKIKYFPTNSASILTIRSHVERCALKGFRPDLIIVDYADIMRSTRQYDSLRHELKLIHEELRGYAGELGIPILTASQSNKEGADSEIIDLTNMSEGYGKAFIDDFVITISRRSVEKASGFGRLYVAKNRAGRDGIIFPVKIDTARSKFEIIGEKTTPMSSADATVQNEQDLKKAIKDKLQHFNSRIELKEVS